MSLNVELAYNEAGTFIGWRLALPTDTLLVWADQARMDGFRLDLDGRGFVPRLGEKITYESANVAPKTDRD